MIELVKIVWHGHACFEIVGKEVNVVTDPHDGHSIGLPPPNTKADVVFVSHHHFDHDAVDVVKKKDTVVIDRPASDKVKGVEFKSLKTWHDEKHGALRGANTVYKFIVDGISFVHCGDLGHLLTEKEAEDLKPIDVLFVPVGGVYTIDAKKAYELVKMLDPWVTIPMHYYVEGLKLSLNGVNSFLKLMEGYKKVWSTENYVEMDEVPKEKTVIVLKPPK